MTSYELHPEAEDDLNAIWEYIADDNIDAADQMIGQIEATIERLVPFPYSGIAVPI